MQSYNLAIVGWTFSILLISRQAREKKWRANDLFWRLMLFYSDLLLLLQPFSDVAFYCHFKWCKASAKGR